MEKIIKKITISVGDIEGDITPEQAKELHSALGDLLGLKTPNTIVLRDHVYPNYPIWPYPIMYWNNIGTLTGNTPDVNKWFISYSDTSSSAKLEVL